ncbi:MAG: DNA primase large subunit PriL [Candidatus Nezhaarchaeales archaeon]
MLSREDLAKYPFTSEASAYIRAKGVTLEDLVKPGYEKVVERAIERIREALEGKGKTVAERVIEGAFDLDVEILSYPVAVFLLSIIKDDYLLQRFAERESLKVERRLKAESEDKLAEIAINAFNWRLMMVEEGGAGGREYRYRMDFADYLSVAMGFKSSYWKLVNRTLYSGTVLITKNELAKLVSEALRKRLIEKVKEAHVEEFPEELKDVVESVRSELERLKARLPQMPVKLEDRQAAYPPCILNLLEEVEAGRNLSHMARFTLATFMLSVGKTVEEVIDLFRRLPDFDEKKTYYHVKHVAGEVGSKTKYTPPRCDTLKTFHLCVNPDALCLKVKHPLSYYRRKVSVEEKAKNC